MTHPVSVISKAVSGNLGPGWSFGGTIPALKKNGETYFSVVVDKTGTSIVAPDGETYNFNSLDWSKGMNDADGTLILTAKDGDTVIFYPKAGTPEYNPSNGALEVTEYNSQTYSRAGVEVRLYSGKVIDVTDYNFLAVDSKGKAKPDVTEFRRFLTEQRYMTVNNGNEVYQWSPDKEAYVDVTPCMYGDLVRVFNALSYPYSVKNINELIADFKANDINWMENVMPHSDISVDDIIPFKNGNFNVKTGGLLPKSEEFFIINPLNIDYVTDTDYPDNGIKEVFEYMLPDPVQRDLLFEYIGYTLFDPRNDGKAYMVLQGRGNCGKSWIIKLVQKMLSATEVRNKYGNVPIPALPYTTIPLTEFGNKFALYGLQDSRANFLTEFDMDGRRKGDVCTDTFKAITAGDAIYAEKKREDGISFTPRAKIWVASNDMPVFGSDSGIALRFKLLCFHNRIPEDVGREYYALLNDPVCLNWVGKQAMSGYMRLVSRHMVWSEPKIEKEKIDEVLSHYDTLGLFMAHILGEDYCTDDIEKFGMSAKDTLAEYLNNTPSKVVYEQYLDYVQNELHINTPYGRNKFITRMEDTYGYRNWRVRQKCRDGYYFVPTGDSETTA